MLITQLSVWYFVKSLLKAIKRILAPSRQKNVGTKMELSTISGMGHILLNVLA